MARITLSFDDWKKETKRGVFTPRSKLLKDVDTAYEKYWAAATDTNRSKLKDALEAWIADKGRDSAPGAADGKWRESTRNKTGTVEALHAQLNPLEQAPAPGEIRFAPSFRMASSLGRTDAKRAFTDAVELIQLVWPKIAVSPSGAARTTFETWFGTFSAARHAVVRKNIDKIHTALTKRPIMLYYRGNGLPGNTPNDEAGRATPIGPEAFFGAAYPQQPPALDQRFTHIFVGQAFFDQTSLFSNDSMGGVMIHELSHAICQTDDVVYKGAMTYGEVLCQRLANERPDLAVNNADCYEYFCESFQPHRYQSARPMLNLPPKASINLKL